MDVTKQVTILGIGLSGHTFMFNNFSIGVTGNFYTGSTVYKEKETDDEKYQHSLLLGGVELRYFIPLSSKTMCWMKASPALGYIKAKYNDEEITTPKRLYQFTGGAGLSYLVADGPSLDLGATYNVFTMRNKGSYTENSRKEYVDNVGVHIGFTLFL